MRAFPCCRVGHQYDQRRGHRIIMRLRLSSLFSPWISALSIQFLSLGVGPVSLVSGLIVERLAAAVTSGLRSAEASKPTYIGLCLVVVNPGWFRVDGGWGGNEWVWWHAIWINFRKRETVFRTPCHAWPDHYILRGCPYTTTNCLGWLWSSV